MHLMDLLCFVLCWMLIKSLVGTPFVQAGHPIVQAGHPDDRREFCHTFLSFDIHQFDQPDP